MTGRGGKGRELMQRAASRAWSRRRGLAPDRGPVVKKRERVLLWSTLVIEPMLHSLLPPDPPHLDNPLHLSGRLLKACGLLWRIDMLGLWRSGPGLFPDLDILCRMTAIDSPAVHSVLVEVDRALNPFAELSGATILRSLERALLCDPIPIVVRVDASAA